MTESENIKTVEFIESWCCDFLKRVEDSYSKLFYCKENKIYPKSKHIKVLQAKGCKNLYLKDSYNPLYIVQYRNLTCLMIDVYVFTYSTAYTITYDSTSKIPIIELIELMACPTNIKNKLYHFIL